jgi:very-short-patch-repair endonuclease
MTDAERRLWNILRYDLGDYKFRRQHPVGRYVADFACVEAALIVEADGSQHCDSTADADRTAWLESRGWRVMRFWNNEILQTPRSVAEALHHHLNAPEPLPQMGEGGAHCDSNGRVRVTPTAGIPSPGQAVPACPPSPIGERA